MRKAIVSILLIMAVATVSLILIGKFWWSPGMSPYEGLTETIVAEVKASPTLQPHTIRIDLYRPNSANNWTADKPYFLTCDEWYLQGEVILSPQVLNIIGWRSGYQLTQFKGQHCYDTQAGFPTTFAKIRGSDDSFFDSVKGTPVLGANAVIVNSNYFPANGKTYDVYVLQSGLNLVPTAQ